MWKGASLGSVHSSYIHGHAWLSDWDMSWGAGGRVCSWGLLQRLLSLPQGLGSGLGESPSHPWREGQPLPGHCTLLEEILGRALSPRPPPSPSPCPQSGVVGEVADRFPGQHRGRLGWSSGQQGRGQVSPGTLPAHSLGSPPSRHCTLWSRGSPDLSHFPSPKARQAWQLLYPLLTRARAKLRQFDWVTGAKGSLQLPPVSSHLREGVPFEVQNPRPPLKT